MFISMVRECEISLDDYYIIWLYLFAKMVAAHFTVLTYVLSIMVSVLRERLVFIVRQEISQTLEDVYV